MNEPSEWEKPADPYTTPRDLESTGAPASGRSCLGMFAVWGLPAVIVPLIIGLFFRVWPVGVMLALGFLAWMGTVQAVDGDGNSRRWAKVVLYVVVQVILIPLVWFAAVWGICVVTGSGRF